MTKNDSMSVYNEYSQPSPNDVLQMFKFDDELVK